MTENQKLIITMLKKHGELSMLQLMEKTSLSRNCILMNMKELLWKNIVEKKSGNIIYGIPTNIYMVVRNIYFLGGKK